jgi:hypothetical protein
LNLAGSAPCDNFTFLSALRTDANCGFSLLAGLNHTVESRKLIKTFNGILAFCKEANLSGEQRFRECFRNGRDFSPSLTAQTDLRGICVMRDKKRAPRNYVNYKS